MSESILHKVIEQVILIGLILLNVLEFIGVLPGEVELVKMIISITGLAYVLYRASLTDIFFGNKKKRIDLVIIVAYMLLITNKFVQFTHAAGERATLFKPFFRFILDYYTVIELTGFFIGTILLILISIYVTKNVKILEPSILDVFKPKRKIGKFFITLVVVVGFHLIFFSLLMEWLSLILDASLVVLAVFLYVFKIHDFGKTQGREVVLNKIAEFVENFVEEFTLLFHSKRTIFLGISALLVLHLITDVGAFILPYNLGTETVYQTSFREGHENFIDLFQADKLMINDKTEQILLFFGYLFNTIATLFLFIFPAFIWYILYLNTINNEKNTIQFPDILMSFFYSSLVYFFFLPTYIFSYIRADYVKNLLGVDIQTKSILASANSLVLISGIALTVFVGVWVLSKINFFKNLLFIIMSLGVIVFFGFYIYNFFVSFYFYYVDYLQSLAVSLFEHSLSFMHLAQIYLFFFNALFLFITILFYVGGYLSFLRSVFVE